MPRVQAYASDEVAQKINAIVESRRSEGASEKDVSFSGITSMLIELGLRVYEAQMSSETTEFSQAAFNKILLENVIKTQCTVSKLLAMNSLSPYLAGDQRFIFKSMVMNIKEDAREVVDRFFPGDSESD